MATLKNDIHDNRKNLYCRDAKANEIIRILGINPFNTGKGCNIRECPYGTDCKGAHRKEEIQIYPHISKWNNLDKSKFDFIKIYKNLLETITKDKTKIKGINDFKNKLENINELNFIELIQLWHDLSCCYRKLAKKIPKKFNNPIETVHTSGYTYSEEVPKFYLDEENEDNCWSMVRTIQICNVHKTFKENYMKKQKVTIWDICLGDKNCKEGVHNTNELLCIDDFLNGKCSCVTKEAHDNKIKSLNEKINSYQTNKPSNYQIKINNLLNEIADNQRKIHYTDENMIPFNIQYSEYKKELERISNEAKKVEESKTIGKVFKISIKKK